MGERNIISYFSSAEDAIKAKEQLLEMGIEVVQIDQFGHVPGSELSDELHNPMTGEIASNAGLVEGAMLDDDSGVLLGSDPAVSGMAGTARVRGYSFILTAVTDDQQISEAVRVLKQHNGLV
ncbi:MAG: hypothetical protein ACOX2K_08725 [Bacillota bacterium]